MADRILTTHVGSLPRPQKLLDVAQKRTLGQAFDHAAFDREMKDGVADVVKHQKDVGIDLINDGEIGHTMGWAYDYGAWWSYVVQRLGGVEVEERLALGDKPVGAHENADGAQGFCRRQLARSPRHGEVPGRLHGPAIGLRAARAVHDQQQPAGRAARSPTRARTTIKRDIDNFKAGLKAAGIGTEGLDELGRAGELRAHAQRVLQDRGGAALRLRRRDARGIQGHRRCRADRAARRPGDRRELGPAEGRAEHRGLSALHQDADRRAQPRDPGPAVRARSASTCAGAAGTGRTPPTCR